MEAENVYRFDVRIRDGLFNEEKYVYTNLDLMNRVRMPEAERKKLDPAEREMQEYRDMDKLDKLIGDIYFNKDTIEEMKKELCERIMADPNPFLIRCNDWDGGWDKLQ